jgi:hypothetical protein
MNRNIGSALRQSHFKLFDKQAFATYFAQAAVQYLIALRGHTQQMNLITASLQEGLNVFSLPHGQATFARGNDNGAFGGRDVLRVQTSNLFVIFQSHQMLA